MVSVSIEDAFMDRRIASSSPSSGCHGKRESRWRWLSTLHPKCATDWPEADGDWLIRARSHGALRSIKIIYDAHEANSAWPSMHTFRPAAGGSAIGAPGIWRRGGR